MTNIQFVPLILGVTMSSMAGAAENTQSEELPTVEVVGQKISDVNVNEVKSADLAEALTKKIAGISLVRRSGIANDIILRGQKKDNINVLFDHSKVYGACPNRMDPPTSHILTNNIDSVEVIEGPYDVESFGTLSGAVKITTKKPEEGLSGNVSLNLGSWDYQKFAATLSGGSEKIRGLFSFSQETGGQYEDGDGNNFYQQIEAFLPGSMVNYKPEYKDMDAYEKNTFMGKLYIDIAENQDMELSYTANRSDDVLYPSSKMDALYDDSDIINFDYAITDLGKFSKELNVQIYNSEVEHPMSTYYRLSSGANSVNEVISYLETKMQGTKLINTMDISATSELKTGIDLNQRNWNGAYEGFGSKLGITGRENIPDVDTENKALFAELSQDFDALNLKYGARFDDTSITPHSTQNTLSSNDYSAVSAFIFSTYQLNETYKLFGGIGRSARVPDARELYFYNSMGFLIGNPDLEDTTNTELDFGVEHTTDTYNMKAKIFYSMLNNFIHYHDKKQTVMVMGNPMMIGGFDNVDATIYGFDVSGSYDATDKMSVDFGLAYQRGKKDEALTGQTDTNLADIPPMKINIALNYEYQKNSRAMIELVAADSWNDFDADNGEQKLDSWSVLNAKVKHQFTEQFGLTAGIDNILDETYAATNTYKDLTLLLDGSGDVMLMNEPGRYLYVNAVYSF